MRVCDVQARFDLHAAYRLSHSIDLVVRASLVGEEGLRAKASGRAAIPPLPAPNFASILVVSDDRVVQVVGACSDWNFASLERLCPQKMA